MRKVLLGSTGLNVSQLAMGTGTHGWGHESDQTRRGDDWLVRLLETGYEMGVNFWDLADQYGSHQHAREALKEIPRDQVVISTKTTARDYQSCQEDVERFLKELGTDYIDMVLLHARNSADWNSGSRGAMDALSEAKEKQLVRAVGISSHNLSGAATAVAEPWVDAMIVILNYEGTRMTEPPEEVIAALRQGYARGQGICAMKVLGCGALTADPEKGIGFVLDLDCVHTMTIGHTEVAQLRQNVEIIERLSA